MAKTAILYIAERCNQSCVFCLEEDGGWTEFTDPTTQEVYDELARLWGRGARHITFMGGETFFRKDLGRIIARAKELGFTRVGVTTNGTVLSKKGFIANLVASGLDFIEMSVHGHTAELANAISQEAITYERQASALAEIGALGSAFLTIVNVVVCRENKDHLADVARYVCEGFPRISKRFKVKMVSLQGSAANQAANTGRALGYEEVDFIGLGDYLASREIPFWFYNVPLCRLGPYAERAHELSALAVDDTYFDLDHRGPAAYYESGHQLEGRVWPEASCGACSLRPICPGLEETYRRVHGASVLSTLGTAPEPLVAFALRDRGCDPSRAAERVEALAREPRPARFIRPRPDGAVRYRHAGEAEPLDVIVEAREAEGRAFATTQRFALSYRRWADSDPHERPGVADLLKGAVETLRRIDANGAGLDDARAALAALVASGWSAEPVGVAPAAPRRRGVLPVLPPGRGS